MSISNTSEVPTRHIEQIRTEFISVWMWKSASNTTAKHCQDFNNMKISSHRKIKEIGGNEFISILSLITLFVHSNAWRGLTGKSLWKTSLAYKIVPFASVLKQTPFARKVCRVVSTCASTIRISHRNLPTVQGTRFAFIFCTCTRRVGEWASAHHTSNSAMVRLFNRR